MTSPARVDQLKGLHAGAPVSRSSYPAEGITRAIQLPDAPILPLYCTGSK